MNVPRAAYVRFPYGNPLGMAHDAQTQRAIMQAALHALYEFDAPGRIAVLPYRWRGQLG